MTKLISRIFTLPVIYVSLVTVVYLISFFLPTPKNPIVSVQEVERVMLGPSISGALPWQISTFWFCLLAAISFIVLIIFCNTAISLLKGNKLSQTLGICLAVSILVTPLLSSCGSDIFVSPIGIPLSLIASDVIGMAIWIIFLPFLIISSKNGAKKLSEEAKGNFVDAVETERDKAPTK